MAEDSELDVAVLVAEIEAEVARRRAQGDYPAELLERLRAEFHPETDQSLDELAHLETVRPLESSRRRLGAVSVLAKRLVRRGVAWYVRPITEDQSRFNFALLAEVAGLRTRLERTETAWHGGINPSAWAPAHRARALRAALSALPAGPLSVLGGDAELLAALRAEYPGTEVASRDPRLLEAARALGVPAREMSALEHLEGSTGSLAGIVLAGVVHRLAPAELLALLPAAAAALRPGGIVYADAPGAATPAFADPAARRPVAATTLELLCNAAGLVGVTTVELGDGWFSVSACQPEG